MDFRPGDVVTTEFCTQVFSTGVATNADSTPTATLNRNGTDDSGVTVTCTNLDTGRYKAVFTIPATYVPGDVLNLTVAATVSSVSGKGPIWMGRVGFGFVTSGTFSAVTSNLSVTLQTALGTDNLVQRARIYIVGGTGAGQSRGIFSYTNSTKVVAPDRAFSPTPDTTSVYVIVFEDSPSSDATGGTNITLVQGTQLAATNGSIVTNRYAFGTVSSSTGTSVTFSIFNGATNNQYVGMTISTSTGTSAGQTRVVLGWNASTKTMTIGRAWDINPVSGDVMNLLVSDEPVTDSSLRVIAASVATTVSANIVGLIATALSETTGGNLAAAFKKLLDVASPVTTVANDSYTRLGAPAGASTAADIAAVLTATTGVGTTATGINTKLGSPAGASVSADIASVLAAIQNIQNNTFIATSIPQELQVPASGSTSIVITVVFSDETGTAKNLDSSANPTVTLVNDAGVDKSARLSSWSNPSTGTYQITYTNTSTDALEGLHWLISGAINTKTRKIPAFTELVLLVSSQFTTADRALLTGISNVSPAHTPLVDSTGAMILTTAYDAAKIAASSTSLASDTASILAAISAGGGSGGGTGPVSVVITVNDGSAPIQLANVSLKINSSIYAGLTDVSGKVTLNPNEGSGTYSVAISAGGYNGLTDPSLAVGSSETDKTYSLSPISLTPSTPPAVTGYLVVVDNNSNPLSNQWVYLQMKLTPSGSTGFGYNGDEQAQVSDINGLVQFTGMTPLATYRVRVNNGSTMDIIASETSPFSILSVIGQS